MTWSFLMVIGLFTHRQFAHKYCFFVKNYLIKKPNIIQKTHYNRMLCIFWPLIHKFVNFYEKAIFIRCLWANSPLQIFDMIINSITSYQKSSINKQPYSFEVYIFQPDTTHHLHKQNSENFVHYYLQFNKSYINIAVYKALKIYMLKNYEWVFLKNMNLST